MHIVGWIVFGLAAGILSGFLLPRRDAGGFLVTTLLGISGALAGGALGRMIGWAGDGHSAESVAGIISGSIIPLAVYGLWRGRSAGA